MEKKYDVIVIGGGGGGSVVAKELCDKGLKVAIFEAGPWYGNKLWPKPNQEQGAQSSKSFDDLSIEILNECFTDLEDDMNSLISGKFRWGPADRDQEPWKRLISRGGFTWQNSGIGGSTLHYLANHPRAYPAAVNDIWPLSYEDMLPYYEKVEQLLPVSNAPGVAKEELFYYGAEKMNWQRIEDPNVTTPGYRPQPNAIIRRGQSYQFPGEGLNDYTNYGCTFRGHCINGCHIGPTVDSVAKRSTLVNYIPFALRTGNVEIFPNSFVIQILTEKDNTGDEQAIGVIVKNTWTKETFEVRATIVVMSAGSIETPRLWLNSKLPENEWVGRGLVNHYFDCITGIFEENAIMEAIGVPNVRPFVGQNAAARFDYPGLGVLETYGSSPGVFSSLLYSSSGGGFYYENKPVDKPWDYEGTIVGELLKEFMRNYQRTLSLVIFTDDEVSQDNGVTLDPYEQDDYGYIPIVRYYPTEKTKQRRNSLATIGANILRAAGAKTIVRADWAADIYIHIMSTMRIGFVTNTDCEALQVKRLYIADNSVLYNSLGGPNPTNTTQALATRTADKIFEKYGSDFSKE